MITVIALVGLISLPIPKGAYDYCQRTHDTVLCDESASEASISYNDSLQTVLFEVHDKALKKIRFQEDNQHYQQDEYWAYPTDNRGDCEDYAIYEAHELVEKHNIPKEALSIVVVANANQTMHAVLEVHTDKADFIMDSLLLEVVNRNHYQPHVVKLSTGSLMKWRDLNPAPVVVTASGH